MPCAARASSPRTIDGLLPLRAMARPSSTSMSLSATPSMRAASATICWRTLAPAISADEPALIACRLAKAPTPCEMAGIARSHDDVLDAAADLIGHDLGERRARALALRGGAGRHRDLAVGKDAHGDALERPKARAFHVVGYADAEVAPVGARFRLPRAKALVV